jgi:predicted RNase H-like HicB family nuclease
VPQKLELTAVYVRDDKWVVSWCEEIPGALGQGTTVEESREDLREAIKLMIDEAKVQSRDGHVDVEEYDREILTVELE